MQRLSNNMHHDRKDELLGGYLEIFICRGTSVFFHLFLQFFEGFHSWKSPIQAKYVLIKSFWNEMKFNFKFFNLLNEKSLNLQ